MLTSVLDGRVFGERVGGPRDASPDASLDSLLDKSLDVVALHGWARTRADMLPLLDRLTGPSDVSGLAIDLPGFGATPPPPQAWGSRDYAELLLPLVESSAGTGRRPVLVGHSFGGRVALQLAAMRPDLLAGLVLTGTPNLLRVAGPQRRPPLAYRLARGAHRRGLLGERRMEALRRRHGSADYRAASGVMRDVLVRVVNEDYTPLLPQARTPVTLVWAEHDTAAPAAMAREAARRFPQAQLVVVDGAHHLLSPPLYDAIGDAVQQILAGERD